MTKEIYDCNLLLFGGMCSLPTDVAVCPECGARVSVECTAWESESGIPTEISFSCDQFDEWCNDGYESDDDNLPFDESGHKWWQSDWQPVRDKMWNWINQQLGSKGL